MSIGNCGNFRDAVCIEAQRIYDSCTDRDCISDMTVNLREGTVCDGNIVKPRTAVINSVSVNVSEVPFSKGYYAVDIVYTFDLAFDVYADSCTRTGTAEGTVVWTKKCILYGCEGNTKSYDSISNSCAAAVSDDQPSAAPKATVRVVDPIVLDARVKCKCPSAGCGCSTGPVTATAYINSECCQTCDPESRVPVIVVTLGIFSIVQLSRPVAVVVPAYDYCIPKKECNCGTAESPCEIFEKLSFPVSEFFPACDPSPESPCPGNSGSSGCGCNNCDSDES